jgi:hypothetical protein
MPNRDGRLATPTRLRCFVAMAFDNPDTDAIYDDAIRPCLKALFIAAIRIDRKEHNDNIDDKILEELNAADFAIADLTYARPSVYFEAGFAERAIPVIYTCRKDHLRAKADDPHGNLKVHFDLLMKNIIAWDSVRDRSFLKRLSKRVVYVTAPILRQQKQSRKEDEESRQFRSLSLRDQGERISETVASALSTVYERQQLSSGPFIPGQWNGVLRHSRNIVCASSFVGKGFGAKDLRWIFDQSQRLPSQTLLALVPERTLQKDSSGPLKVSLPSIEQDIFVCSIDRTPSSRITSAFPDLSYDYSQNWFFGTRLLALHWRLSFVTIRTRLHVIDQTSSMSSLRGNLQHRLDGIRQAEKPRRS